MFEDLAVEDVLSTLAVHDFTTDDPREHGASLIDAITAYERLIRAAQGRQLALIAQLAHQRRHTHTGTHDPDLSVAGEIAMARGVSPTAGGTQLATALTLADMPHTASLLETGRISHHVARAVVKETQALTLAQLDEIDPQLAPQLPGLTPKKAAAAARRLIIDIDSSAATRRAEANRADVRVSLHTEPDGVATLIVRAPAEQLVPTYEGLLAHARAARAAGTDTRTTGQIMATSLVERVTGLAHAAHPNVEIGLLMDLPTLLGEPGQASPVTLTGYGPIPAGIADHLLAHAPHVSLRRLFTDPVDGTLIARDTRRRLFDGPLGAFVRTRDPDCTQPFCDCRTRDLDHVQPWADDGPTTAENAQGVCRRSHTLKHLPGWHVTRQSDGTTTWHTPTGHTYNAVPRPINPPRRQ